MVRQGSLDPLLLAYFGVPHLHLSGGPEQEALQNWLVSQFRELNILGLVGIDRAEEFISIRVLAKVVNRSWLIRILINQDTLCCCLRPLRGNKPHLTFSSEIDFSLPLMFL